MLGLMLLGLAWLVVNYLAGDVIAFMVALGSWNFLIGFALIVDRAADDHAVALTAETPDRGDHPQCGQHLWTLVALGE